MMSVAISKAHSLVPATGNSARSSNVRRGRRRAVVVRAVTVSEDTVDLGALVRDALTTPAGKRPVAPDPAAPQQPPAVTVPEPAPPAAATSAPVEAPAPAASVTVDPVPGTEILPDMPAPQPEAAPSQGFDFVLDQLQDKPPGYGAASDAAQAAKAQAASLADNLGDSFSSAKESLGGLFSAGKGLGSGAADSASDALGGAADAVTGVLGGTADSISGALGGAAGAFTGATSGAADAAASASAAATAAVSQAADALTSALSGVTGVTGGAVNSAQSLVGGAVGEFSTEVSGVKATIDSLLGGVTDSISSATAAANDALGGQLAGATAAVSQAVDTAVDALPPELRTGLVAAGGAVAGAGSALFDAIQELVGFDPRVGAAVTGAAVGLPALLAWNAVYGGYAGTLSATEAFDVLQNENALLLDVRSEQARFEKGVAELRRGALGKGAAVPPVQLLPSVSKLLRDAAGVALEIQAQQAAALARIDPRGTKVIVMDAQGDSAKRVARALRAAGVRRPYVLAGGFRAWQEAGLAVREGAAEYDSSPLEAVEDLTGTVVERAQVQLRDPTRAATAAGVLAALGFAAYNYHTALQFLGVLGLEVTLLLRLLSYDSLDDALEDLRNLYDGAANIAALPGKATATVKMVVGGARPGDSKQAL